MNRTLNQIPGIFGHQLRSPLTANRSQLHQVFSKTRVGWNTTNASRFGTHGSTARLYARTARGSRTQGLAGITGLGVTGYLLFELQKGPIRCEPTPPKVVNEATPIPRDAPLPPPPQSAVNAYELGFGTVCGICAGVFVKKGARLAAFAFGGVFVLLQYFASLSYVRVDWTRMASRFENLFYRVDDQGVKRAPSVGSLVRWIIDFLTADFQQRASFIAGFALGLRVG